MTSRVIKKILLFSNCSETLFSNLISYRDPFVRKAGIQRRESWGNDYPEKTFFVIRRPNNWGLGSILVKYVQYFEYAHRRGWTPVVDMESAHNIYLKDDKLSNGDNAWEWFFQQPANYSLSDIKNAKNIVIAPYHLVSKLDNLIDYKTMTSNVELGYWQSTARKYIHLSNHMKFYLENLRRTEPINLLNKERVLGVYCRGTDYLRSRPKGHPVQPNPQDVAIKAKEIMKAKGLSYIFLVTEDDDILNLFCKKFPGKVIYVPGKIYNLTNSNDDWIWQSEEMKSRDGLLNGLEYLSSIKLLAECDCIIGGVTGGSAASLLLSKEQFEYRFFWNLGRY